MRSDFLTTLAAALIWIGLSIAIWYAIIIFFTTFADAHDAPTGWSYGWECCSGMDCRQLPQSAVATTAQGYLIKATGEVIPYGDKRIKLSKDEFYHQCTPGGDPKAKHSICLYAPNQGF